ncbi:MAG: hypothetical protein R2822_03770 [Spirosomataceae bacterium]
MDAANFPEKYTAKKIRAQINTDKLTVKNLYEYVTGGQRRRNQRGCFRGRGI